ncbi:MAG: peptidylprolyl isomerase [Rickettsiales bacterium]
MKKNNHIIRCASVVLALFFTLPFYFIPLCASSAESSMLKMTLPYGDVLIQLFPDKAPAHVERITRLTKEGFYNNVPFHRVIDGFMAQTGDPTGTGTGGSKYPDLKQEFNSIPHTRGIVSMARASNPNSANSQFFIVLDNATFLDNQYTVFGKVVKGMEYVDMIKKGDSRQNGTVVDPDRIISMTVEEPQNAPAEK